MSNENEQNNSEEFSDKIIEGLDDFNESIHSLTFSTKRQNEEVPEDSIVKVNETSKSLDEQTEMKGEIAVKEFKDNEDIDDENFISNLKKVADTQKLQRIEEKVEHDNKNAKNKEAEALIEVKEQQEITSNNMSNISEKDFSSISIPNNIDSNVEISSVTIKDIHNKNQPDLPPRHVAIKDLNCTAIPSDSSHIETGLLPDISTEKKSSKRSSIIKITPVNPVPPSFKDELTNPVFMKNLKELSPPELPMRAGLENVNKKELVLLDADGQPIQLQNGDISEKIDIIRANSKSIAPEFDLIVNRFEINRGLRDFSDAAIEEDKLLKETFKKAIDSEESKTDSINFWNSFVSDQNATVRQHPEQLERLIFSEGIPTELRPFVWKFITQSNLKNLEVLYANNVVIKSEHESQIEKDIKRTNFITAEKQEMLKNVCTTYSNYDLELGYTQGLCFIIAPLILTLDSEVEAFSLLVKLMHDYDLRSFYINKMPGLMLKLYQFEKIIQEHSPAINEHLASCGILSNMFVSQWLLSFFGYKFPYEFVIRIFDIVLLEGLEALLKFAVAVVLKNEEKILSMKFDELLKFLKDDLFNVYALNQAFEKNGQIQEFQTDVESVEKHILSEYNVSQFAKDALEVLLMPVHLQSIENEFQEISELKKSFNPVEKEIQRLKIINKNQVDELIKVKSSFSLLKKDHELIANELINKRQLVFYLNDQINLLHEDVGVWEKKYNQMIENSKLENPDANIPTDLKEGLDQVLVINKRVMEKNLELESEVEALKDQLKLFKEAEPTSERKWKLFKK
ncbi:hypothetical protein QEN19_000239 [Hanseniaspora menglaensis]